MVLSRSLAIVFLPALVAINFVSGCSSSENPAETTRTTEDTSKAETEAERCRKKLAAAIQRVNPKVLVLQDKPERSINSLNAWIASCAAEEIEALEIPEESLALIGESGRASSKRFTVSDAKYIRDCILLRDLSDAIFARCEESAGASGATDADRVTAIFDWLTRNVSLLAEGEDRVPLSLFDVLMTGRGTPEDRAWLFAETLRQQQIDGVLIETDAAAEDGGAMKSATMLMVVFLEGSTLLFDPRSGLLVNESDSPDAKPATLQMLTSSERWKGRPLGVVATQTSFAPRMLVLQEQLAAADAAILYEELTGGVSEILPLNERVKTGDDTSGETITVWGYPEQQTIAANALDEEQRLAYTELMRPFQAPFRRKQYESESIEELTTVPEELSDEEREALLQNRLMADYARIMGSSEDMFGKPSKGLLKARLKQILGESDTSVNQQLQQVRIAGMQKYILVRIPDAVRQQNGGPEVYKFPFPEVIRNVNQSSTGSSLYWAAMCQMDREEYGTAASTLMNYRRQHPDEQWTYPSLMNQALCLLAQDRKSDALELLKEANKDENPEQLRAQLLISRLEAK